MNEPSLVNLDFIFLAVHTWSTWAPDSFLQLTGKLVLTELLKAAAPMEQLQLEQVIVPTSAGATELSSLQDVVWRL